MQIPWEAVAAVAAVISTAAYVATALYIRRELKHLEKNRFIEVTSQLFAIWQSPDFMSAQLWLLHTLEETTWEAFVRAHRADAGEAAFHRVGSFYDRVGTLVRLKMVDAKEILSTIGPHAIAVWQKIEPLVREARRLENSVLFDDFEALLPACRECYVPALGPAADVTPFSLVQPRDRITVPELKRRLAAGEALTLLDVRSEKDLRAEPEMLPGAVRIPPEALAERYRELPQEREVIVYCA